MRKSRFTEAQIVQILAEHDATNAKAVQACGERWTAAGREVIVVRPRVGKLFSQESPSVTPQNVTRPTVSRCFTSTAKKSA